MTDPDKTHNGINDTADKQTETISFENIKSPNPVITTLELAIAPFLSKSGITADSCEQKFQTLGISRTGKVCLGGAGQDFIFNGKYIIEVLPCVEAHPTPQHFLVSAIEALGAVTDYWINKTIPKRPESPLYTAIKIGGKYNCMVFVKEDFKSASAKLSVAKRDAQNLHDKEFR